LSNKETAPKPRLITGQRILGVAVFALAIASGVQGWMQSTATEQVAQCTKAYASGFADALDERSKATAEAQDALDDLITAVASATPTQQGRDAVRQALTDYLNKRAEAKRTQAEHPYPAPPRDVCE
jgi:type II secretory pathway pseudopilin PulG